MTRFVSSAVANMMPTIPDSEMDIHERYHLNGTPSLYSSVSVPVDNRLNYHSSIMNLYHQHMHHSPILNGNLPLSVPSNIASPSLVALACGIPNLNHISILDSEYQRQVCLQAELYNSATFNHLPFPAEEFHQHNKATQTRTTGDIHIINNSFGKNGGKGINNASKCNNIYVDSGPNYPAGPQLFSHTQQKSDLSLHHTGNHQDSGLSKPKKSKESKSMPITEEHKKTDSKWHASFEQLKQYKEMNGHTIVPRGYSLNSKLASWVAEQRKQYRLLLDNRKSAITPHRIKLLDELDFVWNAQEEAWRRQMKLLSKFHSEYGHCNVQLNNPDYPKLGLWVKEQRRHYMLMKQGRPSHMTLDRYRQLSELDFCYDTHESTWQHRLAELEEFKRNHGNCVVSSNNANSKLAVWVHHQRRQYKKLLLGLPSHMSQDRMKALNDIGFVWFPRKKPGNSEQDACDSDANEEDDVSIDPKTDDSVSDADEYCPPVNKRQKI